MSAPGNSVVKDAPAPHFESVTWPKKNGLGKDGKWFYLVDKLPNGRILSWGTVIERKERKH